MPRVRGEPIEAVKRPFRQAPRERSERIISIFSKNLGYAVMHRHYEDAVNSWKKAQQKS